MVFVIGCTTGLVVPSSNRDGKKAGNVSPPDLESLRSRDEFRRVLSQGRRYRSGGIVVVRSLGRPGRPRVGLIVGKSSGGAVTRNRIKRRLRHVYRNLPLKPGTDYVIIGSRQVATVSHRELVGWLQRAVTEVDDE